MIRLNDLFDKYGTDKGSILHNYGDAYERHLYNRLNTNSVLEIGVGSGASLRAWCEWFPYAQVHGIDLALPNNWKPHDRIHLYRGNILNESGRLHSNLDVIIDDGSHHIDEINGAIHLLWDHLRPNGWYVVEDIAPSKYQAAMEFYWRADEVAEMHRYGEIVFAKKLR